MLARGWQHVVCGFGLVATICIGSVPASAQVRELLQELVRPPPPPVEEPVQAPEYEDRTGPVPHAERGEGHWEGLREQMFQLREGCEQGDRRSCVRLGIIIGENKQRRAQWRHDHPELFWYER